MTTPYKKTPPKSAAKIRSSLESVRQEVDRQVIAGPYRDGFPADMRVVIAAFHWPEAGRRFQEVLLRAGIMSQGVFHRNGAEISVNYSDCDRAAELRVQHLAKFPDRPLESSRRDFDFAIFGSLLGCTFGVIVGFGELEILRQALVVLFFTLFGGMSGYFVDRTHNRYRRTGHLQFGIGDVLAVMTLIGLGLLIWRLLLGR